MAISSSDNKLGVSGTTKDNYAVIGGFHSLNDPNIRRARLEEQLKKEPNNKGKDRVGGLIETPDTNKTEQPKIVRSGREIRGPLDQKIEKLLEENQSLSEKINKLLEEIEVIKKEKADFKEKYSGLLLKLSNLGISIINGEPIKTELIPKKTSYILRSPQPIKHGYSRIISNKKTTTEVTETSSSSTNKDTPVIETVPNIIERKDGEVLEESETTPLSNVYYTETSKPILKEIPKTETPSTQTTEAANDKNIIDGEGKEQITHPLEETSPSPEEKLKRISQIADSIIDWTRKDAVNAASFAVSANGKL